MIWGFFNRFFFFLLRMGFLEIMMTLSFLRSYSVAGVAIWHLKRIMIVVLIVHGIISRSQSISLESKGYESTRRRTSGLVAKENIEERGCMNTRQRRLCGSQNLLLLALAQVVAVETSRQLCSGVFWFRSEKARYVHMLLQLVELITLIRELLLEGLESVNRSVII